MSARRACSAPFPSPPTTPPLAPSLSAATDQSHALGPVPVGPAPARSPVLCPPLPPPARASRPLRLTHLDKPLWPPASPGSPAYTKGDYLEYLRAIAPAVLPHLWDRPLVLTRYPHGIEGTSFYQKRVPPSAPPWLSRFHQGSGPASGPASGVGPGIDHLMVSTLADLLWVGQQVAIEFHPWLATCHAPEHPDRAVVDLDPMPPASFADACAVAIVVRAVLSRAGLLAWPKTSGATGLHLFIPIRPVRTPREVTTIIRGLGEVLAQLMPERVTLERRIALRGGRVYFDYLQNGRGKTLCAPYSPRPLRGAPVSTPIDWAELPSVRPEAFDLRAIPRRLAQRGEAFAGLLSAPAQDLQALADLCQALGGGRPAGWPR